MSEGDIDELPDGDIDPIPEAEDTTPEDDDGEPQNPVDLPSDA